MTSDYPEGTIFVKVTQADLGADHSVNVIPGSDGAARCALSFNPDENPDVARLKALAAGFMQACSEHQKEAGDPDARRCFETAMTQIEAAQMFAVKGLFTKRNRGLKS